MHAHVLHLHTWLDCLEPRNIWSMSPSARTTISDTVLWLLPSILGAQEIEAYHLSDGKGGNYERVRGCLFVCPRCWGLLSLYLNTQARDKFVLEDVWSDISVQSSFWPFMLFPEIWASPSYSCSTSLMVTWDFPPPWKQTAKASWATGEFKLLNCHTIYR